MSDNQVLIIDADIPLFRSSAKAQNTMVVNGVAFSCAQTAEQNYIFDEYVERVKTKTGINDVVMAITDRSGNFRKDINEEYKAQRTFTPKPVGYWLLLDYIEDTYGTISKPLLEADDVLGILGSQGRYKGKEVVIISDDKDLRTIPCKFVDTKRSHKIITISEQEADRFHMIQTLMGDTVDNYNGCPGVGPKTAPLLLDKAEDKHWDGKDLQALRVIWWQAVVAAFEKAGFGEEEAILQARMARILRVCDWDKRAQKVKLWNPPQ